MEDLDAPWDDDAPLADPDDVAQEPTETPTTDEAADPPSSSEMAGDGAVGGDGIDEPGWD